MTAQSFYGYSPARQWMDHRCWLGNSSTASGSSDHVGTVAPSQLVRRDFIISCPLLNIFTLLRLSFSVSLSYVNHTIPMSKCSGEHMCMSSEFSIPLLNET